MKALSNYQLIALLTIDQTGNYRNIEEVTLTNLVTLDYLTRVYTPLPPVESLKTNAEKILREWGGEEGKTEYFVTEKGLLLIAKIRALQTENEDDEITRKAERIISDLDEYAREYDRYEYGLPTHDDHMTNMVEIVKTKLS